VTAASGRGEGSGSDDFSGLRAFVAASSRGLGRAIALELGARGAHVAVNGTSAEGVAATARAIEAAQGRAVACPADLASAGGPEAAVARAAEAMGGLDVLVTNTGGPKAGAFDALSDDDWQAGVNLVLLSAVRLVRAALPHLVASPSGRIVAVLSSSVRQPLENLTLSNVLRPALAALVRDLSLELAPRGVLVNAVAPGRFDTDRVRAMDRVRAQRAGVAPDAYRRGVEATLPAGRYGRPAELAEAVAFLASPRNTYILGQTLLVDGGLVRAL
jgi:3-oxoacyl-[acyl-carrier protein] reductase